MRLQLANNDTPASEQHPSETASLLPAQHGSNARTNWGIILISMVVCGAWLAASSGIIVANRFIIVDLAFQYPMAVSSMGNAVAFVFALIYCDLLGLAPAVEGMSVQFYITHILPIGIAQGMGYLVSNVLVMHVTISFIEVARATMPLFTMVALAITGLETPTSEVVRAVSLTAIGCGVAAYGEMRLTGIGATLLLVMLLLETLRLVLVQFLLVGCKHHPFQGLKLITPAAVASLVLLSYWFEYPRMVATGAFGVVTKNWATFMAAATLGLVVNLLSLSIIKMSSATTLKVLATIRGPLVVMCGVVLFSEQVTTVECLGYSVALIGFTWYQLAQAKNVLKKEATTTTETLQPFSNAKRPEH